MAARASWRPMTAEEDEAIAALIQSRTPSIPSVERARIIQGAAQE